MQILSRITIRFRMVKTNIDTLITVKSTGRLSVNLEPGKKKASKVTQSNIFRMKCHLQKASYYTRDSMLSAGSDSSVMMMVPFLSNDERPFPFSFVLIKLSIALYRN